MPAQVSPRQLELLLDYMEEHRALALGRVRGKEASVLSKRLWAECTGILNSEFTGAQKSAQEWKKYYNQYKSRAMSKIRAIKQGLTGTGGGPATGAAMTPLEERLYGILGGCTSPLPVRHNPLEALTDHTYPEPEPQCKTSNFSKNPPDISTDHTYPAPEPQPEPDFEGTSADFVEPAEYYVVPNENEDLLDVTITLDDGNNLDKDDTVQKCIPTKRQRENNERTRKRRRRRSRSTSIAKENKEFEAAGKTLAAMENSRIEVEKSSVAAMNRCAAGFEGIQQSLNEMRRPFEELALQFRRFVDLYEANSQPRDMSTHQ